MIAESRIIYPGSLTIVRGIVKYAMFCSLICLFLLHHSLMSLLLINEDKRLRYFMRSIKKFSVLALKILDIEVEVEGLTSKKEGRLLIANHMSYVDVLVLFSHYPSLFITSVEIKETPVLGLIAKFAGCFFVERRKDRRSVETKNIEIASMNLKLKEGFDIFLFPEGTSTDGSYILPFKSTFFQTAIDCQTKIVPICLVYEKGLSIIPWHGDMTFPDHLFKLCLAGNFKAKLIELEPAKPECDRNELKNICYQRIANAYAKY